MNKPRRRVRPLPSVGPRAFINENGVLNRYVRPYLPRSMQYGTAWYAAVVSIAVGIVYGVCKTTMTDSNGDLVPDSCEPWVIVADDSGKPINMMKQGRAEIYLRAKQRAERACRGDL